MEAISGINSLAHVIQIAIAPVFLLTGVGAILSVLTNRLARVVDRFRTLERKLHKSAHKLAGESTDVSASQRPDVLDAQKLQVLIESEMGILSRRARMIHIAIACCTSCALLVCVVIATLFIGSVSAVEMPLLIAIFFILAMLALVIGLLCFLREIALATGSIHTLPR